ncbi:hypothetical protein FIV42_07785 [Persicimonas caeni]|uniref:IPT/TIG domain-containing protein n=1 Tax=Persicimonas caeni TaxID=2292766 RepID=A0A4Y6PS73_PERCE|nr:hypothetical protein [Persicimonas caeni]QDG50635.1 hypothetical protein FIV42_07785 [Persicimonas caeni]QED31856.1 hypothetical protein FRD00_07780 [Persicimonas caeni]
MSVHRLSLAVLTLLAFSLVTTACADDPDENLEPAVLTISYPEQGGYVNKSRVRVSGTAENVDEVMVNGTKAEVVAGEFEANVNFEEGPQTVTVTARDAQESVDFTVDTIAPVIVLDSPARGVFVDGAQAGEVVFEGVATDEGTGLKVLALDGAAVSYDEAGDFSHVASLDEGYNEFELRAVDMAGNEATTLRGAIYGPLADPTSEIDSAAEILLSPAALETATEVIEGLLTPERVTGFVQSSLSDNGTISVDSVDFDALDATLTPNSPDSNYPDGYVGIEVLVTNFQLAGTATIGSDDYPITITIDETTITTEVVLKASEAGGLDVSFGQSELDLAEENLHFTFDGFSEQDLSESERDTLRTIAVNAAKAAFSDLLSDQIFDQLYDPGVLRRKVELLGRTLEFQLYIRAVRTNSEGIYLNASIAIVSDRYEEVPEAPGALNLPLGARSAPKVEGDILFTTHRSAINRILHGAWRSGLLTLELAGADFAGYDLPVELTASALAILLDDRIGSLDEQTTPAGLKLRPQLPPVASLGSTDAEGSDIGIELGELLVDLRLLPTEGEPIEIVTVALFVDITAQFEARDGKLALSLDAEARADIDQEHEIDLDDKKVEDLFANLIELTSEMLGDKMELTAAAELEWLTIDNPEAEIHGEQGDQLSIVADVNANADAVQ